MTVLFSGTPPPTTPTQIEEYFLYNKRGMNYMGRGVNGYGTGGNNSTDC